MADRINFQVGYTVDKTGLSEMQSLFQQIANMAKEPGNQLNTGLQKAAVTANTLDGILEKTFNTNLGTLNVTKFNQELSKSGLTLKSVQADLSSIGNQGATAYNRLAQAILGTNLQLKESNKLLDSMATTMANTVKWGITSSIFNNITNSVQKAYTYTKQLNTSLNDIRIVTDKSADSMSKFAVEANNAAKELGANTLDYTNASLIYYQQGLSDAEVAARAETTIKAANVTGQTGDEVSEQLTAVWNGYKVTAEETEAYVDKLAAVAATTAADLEELSVGMSKVASAANAMGVDFDDLNAQIATIVSVTRQAPESVGTALKTIYARLGDLKVDGVDEFGVKLGEVSSQMQTMGIQILDQEGNLRDMSSVIAEVAQKWGTWTEAQRQAAAVAMAGKRQYNNLIALFDNWDMYTDALNTSIDALGTLQEQQDIYMESTAAKLKTLKATWQDLYGDLINEDELNTGIEGLTNLVQVFDNFIESFGGGLKSIGAFGAIVANIFNKQITNGINDAIQRQEVFKQNLALAEMNAQVRAQGVAEAGVNATPQDLAIEANTKIQLEYAQKIYDARIGLNQEQYNTLIGYQKEIGQLEEEIVLTKETVENTELKYLADVEISDILKGEVNTLDKINAEYGEIESQAEENLSITKLTKEAIQQQFKSNEEISIIKQRILSEAKDLSKEEYTQINNLLKEVQNSSDLENIRKDIFIILEKSVKTAQKNVQSIKEEEQATNRVVQAREKINQKLEQKNNMKQQIDAMLDLGNNATIVAQKITTITSSLSNMAMAWSSLNSLIETWTNDSLSTEDKMLQSLFSIGMLSSNLIPSFLKLNEILKAQQVLKQKNILYTKLETEAETLLNLQGEKKNARLAIEQAATGRHIKLTEEEIGLLEKRIVEETAENKIKETENIITKKQTTSQYALNAARAADPIMWVVAGLTALVAIAAVVIKIQKQQIEQQKELNKEKLEEYNKVDEEAKKNKELIDSYNELIKSFKENKISRSDLSKGVEELCDRYDIENGKILALSGQYEKLTKIIDEKRKKELKYQQITAKEGIDTAVSNALLTQQENKDFDDINDRLLSLTNKNYNRKNASFIYGGMGALGDEDKGFLARSLAASVQTFEPEIVLQGDLSTAEGLVKYYNELISKRKEYEKVDAKATAALTEEINKYKDDVDIILSKWDVLSKINIETQFSNNKNIFSDAKLNYENFAEEYDKILNETKNNLSDFLSNGIITSEQYDIYLKDSQEYLDNLVNQFDTASTLLNQKQFIDVYKNLQNIDFGTWSEEDKAILFSGRIKISGVETEKELKQAVEIAQNEIEQEDLGVVVSLRTKLTSDKKLSKKELKEAAGEQSLLAEEYDTLLSDFDDSSRLEQLDKLNQIVEDKIKLNQEYVATIREETKAQYDLDNINKKELEEEYNRLRIKKESAHSGVLGGLTEEEKERYEELIPILEDLNSKIEEEEYLLEEGFTNSLDDTIFNNLIDGVDGVISRAELLKDLAEEVGENWQIAADKIEDFGLNFPEVIAQQENYNTLQDGSIQLTEQGKQILQEQLEARQQELATANEEYKLELQKQADIQYATAEYYRQQISSLQNFVDGKQSATKTEKQLEKNKHDYTNNLIKITGQDENDLIENIQTNLNNTNTNAQGNTKDIYDYWCSVGEAAKLASLAYESQSFTPPGFAGGGAGGKTNVVSYSQSKSTNDVDNKSTEGLTKEAAKAMIKEFTKLEEDARHAGDLATAKIARLGSATNAATKAMQGAASGKGGKESKSKSGGGGKDKDKDEKEYKDEFDRYWELKKAIDAVDKAISKLDKDQENLYGYELIRSLRQENQLLEQQAANYEKLAAAQQAEAAELRAQLGTMGVMFDASGAITNYAAATAQALAEYNTAIQQYNAGLIDETTLGVYEKAYENFKKLLERYDTLFYNELKDTEEKLDEIRRKELANNLKAWEVEIDLKLNFKELKRSWNNFFKEVKEDFKKVFKDLTVEVNNLRKNAKTYLKENGTIAIDIQAVKDVTREIDKMRKGGSSDMFESISQAQEKLKDLNDQLQDHAKELHDLWKEAWDAYLEGIDQVGDKFDDLMDRFEKINEELDFQRELIQLIYGDEAYKLMDSLYKGQEKSLENQLQSVKEQVDMWKQLFAESGAALDNQEDWDEDQQKYYESWQEAQSKLNDLTLDYIKLLKEDYINTVNDVLKQLDKALTGSTLEDIKTQWERISDYSDKYLDDVEKAYETQKLANKIDESIASTSNLKNQQKLQALRDKEIGYLREKEHLTQYDLDAAEARYQIALKEMALEDARNNKTSMKLVRNEQGNWSYQYLVDEEEVANKQQELLDAYNNLYQLASDAYESNLESLQELQEQYLESAREIYASETLSEEEKEQKLLELRNWYFEQYALLAEENTLYRNDLATSASALLLEIYEQDQEAYNAMTDAEKALLDDLLAAHIDGYMDLEEKIKENYKNIDDASRELMADTRLDWTSSAQLLADLWNKDKGGSVRYEVLDAHKQIQKATENYKSKIDWLADAVERNFGESGIRGAIDKAADATENLKDKTEELVDDGVRYIESLKSVVEELEDAWKSVQDAIEDAINLIEEYLKYVGEANAAAASTGNVGGGSSATVSTPSGKNGGSGSGGSGNGGKSFNPTESQQYDTGRYYYLDGAYDEKGNRINQQDLTLNEAKRLQEVLKSKKGNPGTIKHYATGGYTGEWSDNNGRLAVLHQKELVLNQDDTSNFLEGINIIRDLSNLNGSINNAIMRSIMNMASAVSGLKPGNINTTNANETNESNNNIFNINAEFPNANNVEEIKEALMSLPNLASQYVARG